MLCVGLTQARDEHISQTKIEPLYHYHIRAPEHIVNSNRHNIETLVHTLKWWGSSLLHTLNRSIKPVPEGVT